MAFVETKNLDGETNLKPKYIPNNLTDVFSKESKILNSVFSIKY
jgi:hypothetical protein